MPDIKLIASDIDGTLLPFGGEISRATKDAIEECRRRGILFVLASGRCYPSAAQVAREMGIVAPLICANGGCIHDENGEIIHEDVFTPEESDICFNMIKDCGWMVTSYVRGKILRLNTKTMLTGSALDRPWMIDDPEFEVIDDDPARMDAEGRDRVYKYEVYSKDPALLERLRLQLTEAGLEVSSSVPTDIEIMAHGAGKGAAVAWLAAQVGATREQTMAFGDNTNDMQMLSAVGWPVAMGNAVAELKAAARIVAPHCAEDGVARVIAKYAFGRDE